MNVEYYPAVKETREAIKTLIERGDIIISEQPAVKCKTLADECGITRNGMSNRLLKDPAIEKVRGIDPKTKQYTIGYILHDDM